MGLHIQADDEVVNSENGSKFVLHGLPPAVEWRYRPCVALQTVQPDPAWELPAPPHTSLITEQQENKVNTTEEAAVNKPDKSCLNESALVQKWDHGENVHRFCQYDSLWVPVSQTGHF